VKNVFKKRNILFVSITRHLYGSELSLLPVVHRLDACWRARFLIEGAGPFDSFLRNEGFTVYHLYPQFDGGRLSKIRHGFRLLWLLYLLRSRKIEFVHVNLHYHADLLYAACVRARVPLVVHVRNMIDGPVSSSFRNYDGIICISQAVRDSLVTQGRVNLGDVADRLWIIPDGRDLSPYRVADRNRVRREWGIDSTVPLVGMAARITPMKGQDNFLRMAALIKQRIPSARFVLAGSTFTDGDAPYLREMQGLCVQLGLKGDVIFAGYRHDMPDVLAAFDCFVHPSREGAFVSVLIEAMASGVPVVASDVDGIPECVGREGAALLLAPDDPVAWADAVVGILSNPGLARDLAEKGKERASRLFDIVPLARATANVLETVYECHAHARRGH
jgi:glycosyltransferase involved in cell wall biosynthesis